jgi:hypothetical protein
MKKKIALVTMAKEEDLYLQEWIDYNLKLGFDDIFIYQNNWRFKNAIQNDKVHFMEWDVESLSSTMQKNPWEWNRHAMCYTHFGKQYHEQYEWAAFFDVDCFLDLKETINVKEFISKFDNVPQRQVVINFAMFGDNGHVTFDENNTSVLERFTKRWDKAHTHSHYSFLPICKLHKDFDRHAIHFIDGEEWIDVDFVTGIGPQFLIGRDVTFDKAQLNHYYTKTLPEWKIKCNKTRAEGDNWKTAEDLFESHNFNDVEDLHALNFFKNNNI